MSIEYHITEILKKLGENPGRRGLRDTPKRVRLALEYLTKGYHETLKEVVSGALFESSISELVVVKDIELYSLCEHHLLPFFGKCHIGYLPNGKVLGLSKAARIVDSFARRLQIQENLTQQIAEALMEITNAKGSGVVIEAKHCCMMMRGVEKQHSYTVTSVMLGNLREDPRIRHEFLSLIHSK